MPLTIQGVVVSGTRVPRHVVVIAFDQRTTDRLHGTGAIVPVDELTFEFLSSLAGQRVAIRCYD